MGVVLRSGGTAYTWKIAYEEAAAAFSPGYLLALEDTAAFLADDTVGEVDSCASADFGIMAEVWSERKASPISTSTSAAAPRCGSGR